MKQRFAKCFSLVICILFLSSFASASTMQYTLFSDFEYMDRDDFESSESELYKRDEYKRISFQNIGNEEEIQRMIIENNIRVPDNSRIVRIEMCVVKERETKLNLTETSYLKNITEHGNGYFKNELIRQSVFSGSNFKTIQNRTVDPYLRNVQIFDSIILRNIISDKNKSLKIFTEYEYVSDGNKAKITVDGVPYETNSILKEEEEPKELYILEGNINNSNENYVSLTVWDMYTFVTFESYNIFKNEWEIGELYIPEGSVFMAVEYNSSQGQMNNFDLYDGSF